MKLLIIILNLMLVASAFGQAPRNQNLPATPPVQTTTAAPLPIAKNETEIAVLKAQLETMRQYDQRLMATVYWSLGGVIALAALLTGYSWFTNFKQYYQDKDRLLKEMEFKFQQETIKLDGKFVAEIKQSFEEINGQIRKNIEVFQKQLTSSTNDRFEGFSKGLEYRFKTLSHAIAEQELKTLESSAKMWIEKDVPINAMREYFDMLAIAIKNESWMIEKCLEAISRILKKGFPATPELRPDANLIGNWSQILNSVHSKHSITVDAIKRQLQALRP